MNKKISLGIIIMLVGIYYIIRNIFPELLIRFDYLLSYKTIFLVVGLIYIFKGQTFGWVLFLIGAYLLIEELMPNLAPIIFPIIVLISGIILVLIGLKENKKWR